MKMRSLVSCAALSLLAACDNPPIPDPPPLNSGPGSNVLFDPASSSQTDVTGALCNKYQSCGLINDDHDMSKCLEQFGSLKTLLIDPEAFRECFVALSCDALKSSKIAEAVVGCLNLDLQSFSCTGESVRYCNLAGACASVECKQVCALYSGNDLAPCCQCHDDIPRPYRDAGAS